MTAERKRSGAERAEAHRARMRAKGLRRIQMWVPDTRTPEFADEARRQAKAIANSPQEKEDMAFIESLAELPDE